MWVISSALILFLRTQKFLLGRHLANMTKNIIRAWLQDEIFAISRKKKNHFHTKKKINMKKNHMLMVAETETTLVNQMLPQSSPTHWLYHYEFNHIYFLQNLANDEKHLEGLIIWTKLSPAQLKLAETENTYNASTSPGGNWLHFPEERETEGSVFCLDWRQEPPQIICKIYVKYIWCYS